MSRHMDKLKWGRHGKGNALDKSAGREVVSSEIMACEDVRKTA